MPSKPSSRARAPEARSPGSVGDLQERAVDRLDPGRAGGDQHRAADEVPARALLRRGKAERDAHVGGAEDQRLEARVGLGDLVHVAQAARRLDQRLEADRPLAPGRGAGLGEQRRGPPQVVRGLDLGHDHRVEPLAGAGDRPEVVLEPRRRGAVDAHADAGRRPAAAASASATAARASSLSSGGTESSRSTTISSATSSDAFSSFRDGRAGTERQERRALIRHRAYVLS